MSASGIGGGGSGVNGVPTGIGTNSLNPLSSNAGGPASSSIVMQGGISEGGGAATTKVDETILQERDRLIKFIKSYIKKNNELPPTTLEYYKFVKLIGKGAFGKVTLGIHKLTGKYVAIKTIEKSYMKDDFSKRKVF